MGILHSAECGVSRGGDGGVGILHPAECGGSGGGGGGVGTVFSFLSSFLSLKVESKPPKICKMQELMIINLIHNLLNQLDSTTINANILLQSNLFKTSLWLPVIQQHCSCNQYDVDTYVATRHTVIKSLSS